MRGVPIGADRDPSPEANLQTAQYLEAVYKWGPASVLKHTDKYEFSFERRLGVDSKSALT